MENRFGFKDLLISFLLLVVIVSIWLAKKQYDRQWTQLRDIRAVLEDQNDELKQLSKLLASGASARPSTGQGNTGNTGNTDLEDLFPRIVELLRERGADDVLVFGGGTIPDEDIPKLREAGIAEIFTPGTTTSVAIDFVRNRVRRDQTK